MIKWEKDETVATVTMDSGENKHNLAFAGEMIQVIDDILADKAVTSMVIKSAHEKVWCSGVDLEWMGAQLQSGNFQAMKDFMYAMNDLFRKLLLAPVPVIAQINGHAFGNGAILSCACDFRLMKSDRGFFCFPEVDLGIPFLPGMIAFVEKAMPYYKFNELKLTGKRATAAELAEDHVIYKACSDASALEKETLAFAKTFQKKRGIFGEHKKRLHQHIISIMEIEDKEIIESLSLFIQD